MAQSACSCPSIAKSRSRPVELPLHQGFDQLPGVQYCVTSSPPWPEAVILGSQHYLLTLGTAVLIPSLIVPLMGGGDAEKGKVIQTSLFVSGISTLLQCMFGTRLPTVTSGSYAYVVPVTSIVMSRRYASMVHLDAKFGETMRSVQGALIVAACFQAVMGFLGLWRNVARLFSPLSVVPVIAFSGLGLHYLGFPMLMKCVEIGLPQLIIFVFVSQYLPRYVKSRIQMCERYSLLISIPIVWLFALILTASGVYDEKPVNTQIICRTDRSGLIQKAPWFYIPYPLQWGRPTFNAGETFAVMAASLVSLFESTGTFHATARYGSATPVPPSVISRGVGWVGIGSLLNGLFGSLTGTAASVENTGLLAMTKVGSRRVTQISACLMILFSVFAKIGAFFASIPLPILAALHCVLYGYVASAGIGFLQVCNLNSFRTKFILGFSLFMGISIPQYFAEYFQTTPEFGHFRTRAQWLNDIVAVVFMSHSTVAALVALILDCTLSRRSEETRRDNGMIWWEKFRLYGSDIRNEEFYTLPWGLDTLFPAV